MTAAISSGKYRRLRRFDGGLRTWAEFDSEFPTRLHQRQFVGSALKQPFGDAPAGRRRGNFVLAGWRCFAA